VTAISRADDLQALSFSSNRLRSTRYREKTCL